VLLTPFADRPHLLGSRAEVEIKVGQLIRFIMAFKDLMKEQLVEEKDQEVVVLFGVKGALKRVM
jgi:hypothetical protein